ncbi:MAG: hypothetical protein PHR06_12555 [Candidatus Cloacimonetes bacterium]|nr:hypothetical protein [Candidatus Cloacimonadota bacterium]
MKPPQKYSQSGRWGSEPKQICPVCESKGKPVYMYKQVSRKMINGKNGWIPTSWLCRKCGHMEIYSEGFEAVREEN